MQDLSLKDPDGSLVEFKPEEARATVIAYEARAELEKRRGNIEEACAAAERAALIQRSFVLWWDAQEKDSGGRPPETGNEPVTGYTSLPADLDKMTVSRWRTKLVDGEHPDDDSLLVAFCAKARADIERVVNGGKPGGAHQAHNSGENEWYTPANYIEAARCVMGGINLDPASSEKANKVVRATRYFDQQADGLLQDWAGRVWMNPPYAQPLIAQFIEKLAESVSSGDVTQAVVLVNNASDTAWGQLLLRLADTVCMHAGRIRFINPHGKQSDAPLQGQMIVYHGDAVGAFEREFGHYGVVLTR